MAVRQLDSNSHFMSVSEKVFRKAVSKGFKTLVYTRIYDEHRRLLESGYTVLPVVHPSSRNEVSYFVATTYRKYVKVSQKNTNRSMISLPTASWSKMLNV